MLQPVWLAMQRDVICRRYPFSFQATIQPLNGREKPCGTVTEKRPLSRAGVFASKSTPTQSPPFESVKTNVSFARRRGDQDAANSPWGVTETLGCTRLGSVERNAISPLKERIETDKLSS